MQAPVYAAWQEGVQDVGQSIHSSSPPGSLESQFCFQDHEYIQLGKQTRSCQAECSTSTPQLGQRVQF
jgi:hypothetical protein